MNSSPMRFTGLTSGMDTQAMVNQLMRAESMRMERLTRRRTMIQWRQEALRSTMTRTNDFRSQNTDFLREGSITNANTWNTMSSSVTARNGGSTDGISVRANSNARPGEFSVRVHQAAQGDIARGSTTHNRNLNTSQSIRTIAGNQMPGTGYTGHTTLRINDVNIRVNTTDSIQQVMDRINNSEAGVRVSFDTMRGNFVMEAIGTGENATIRTSETGNWGVLAGMGLDNLRQNISSSGTISTAGNALPQLTQMTGSNSVFEALRVTNDRIDDPATATRQISFDGINYHTITNATTIDDLVQLVNDNTPAGVTASFSGGRFRINGATNTDIIPGMSGDADMLRFIGMPTDGSPVGNRAHTDGVSPSLSNGVRNITYINEISGFEDFTGYLTFTIGGQDVTLYVTATTPLEELWTAMDAVTGTSVSRDGNNLIFRAATPDGAIGALGYYDGDADAAGIAGRELLQSLFVTTSTVASINDSFETFNGMAADQAGTNTTRTIWNVTLADLGHTSGDPIRMGNHMETGAEYHINAEVGLTLGAFMNRVNASNSNSDVRMVFDEATNTFSLVSRRSGDHASIITGNEDVMDLLGLANINVSGRYEISDDGRSNVYDTVNGNNVMRRDDRITQSAQNAVVYYDPDGRGGAPMRIEQASNNIDIHGTTITLTRDINRTIANSDYDYAIFNISSERNIEDTMQAIRDFVEQYNAFIRELNALHTTERPRAGNSRRGAFFEPLTDEQRQGMSDREIERWEEQARTGLLHRDRDIRNMHNQIRQAMFNPVVLSRDENGRPLDQISMFNVGITTVGRDGAPGDQLIGVLQIDESRLRAALEEDPSRVQALFARSGYEAGMTERTTIQQRNDRAPYIGLGNRLDDLLRTFADDDNGSLRQRAGYTRGLMVSENIMSRQLREYDRRMDAMQAHLLRRENHFFAMFGRMEAAMAQAHAQMDSLFAFGAQ
ncbi:MAG: flagellar filament capping protein FliD [Defluviitaleaceae bacterium]|nr:flagellar filament capping protein FliD [Defluviitaleaceae bacterium]